MNQNPSGFHLLEEDVWEETSVLPKISPDNLDKADEADLALYCDALPKHAFPVAAHEPQQPPCELHARDREDSDACQQ